MIFLYFKWFLALEPLPPPDLVLGSCAASIFFPIYKGFWLWSFCHHLSWYWGYVPPTFFSYFWRFLALELLPPPQLVLSSCAAHFFSHFVCFLLGRPILGTSHVWYWLLEPPDIFLLFFYFLWLFWKVVWTLFSKGEHNPQRIASPISETWNCSVILLRRAVWRLFSMW